MHKGRPVIALEGVETMTEAEALHGVELRVPPEALHALPAGSYYEHDLVGCTLTTEDGQLARRGAGRGARRRRRRDWSSGTGATSFRCHSSTPSASRSTWQARRIVVRPPEGLIGLNG